MQISKAGDQLLLPASATLTERNALAEHLIELRKQGHAVIAHEVISSGEQSGDIGVIHYKSCEACKEGFVRKEKVNG